MKHLFLLVVCILCCNILAAKERIIEQPPFIAWSSNTIEIDKIVLSDTATVFFVNATYRPQVLIKTSSSTAIIANGIKYPVKGSIGIELDKEFRMPDNGKASFQLIFPPIPASTQVIDYNEGDLSGSWKIWGIQLKEKKLLSVTPDKEWSKVKLDYDAPLVTPRIKKGIAVVNGKILDYYPGMNIKAKIHSTSLFSNQDSDIDIIIRNDGTFQVEVPLFHTTLAYFISSFPSFYRGEVILSPNETCKMLINTREITRSQSALRKTEPAYGKKIYFDGAYAALNEEIANNDPFSAGLLTTEESYVAFMKDINGMKKDDYKAYLLNRYRQVVNEINNSTQSNGMKQHRTLMLQQSILNLLDILTQNQAKAYRMANKLDRSTPIPGGILQEPDDAYYSYLKEFDLNNPLWMLSPGYKYQIASLAGRTIWTINTTPLKRLASIYGTDKGILFDQIRALPLIESLNNFTPLTPEELVEIKTYPNPVYTEILTQINADLLIWTEEIKKKTGYTLNETPNVAQEKLFDTIISHYKGQVIFVDFWATWCGPCRTAMKDAEPVKAQLAGKEIVFLYLTGEYSPLGIWRNMIPDIPGEHYRIPTNKWDFICSKYSVNGVPSYMIIGKDGKPIHFQVGFMGADKMKEMLLNATK